MRGCHWYTMTMSKPPDQAKTAYHKPTTLEEARINPRYQGKIVIAAGGKVFGTRQEKRAVELYRKLRKQHPDDPPVTTVIPPKNELTVGHWLAATKDSRS
jgi:hypothetical protein